MKNKIVRLILGAIVAAPLAYAGVVTYSRYLVNEPGLAYNKNFPLNLQGNNIGSLTAQAVYSSATYTSKTFTDGQVAVGTVKIPTSQALLSAARATNNVTIDDTEGLAGAILAFPGYLFREGVEWRVQDTTALTAADLKRAMTVIPNLSLSVTDNVVYATAPYGASYNGWELRSNNGNMIVAQLHFVGGQDAAVVTVAGQPLRAAKEWAVGGSSVTTAGNLKDAINANTRLSGFLTASVSHVGGEYVTLQSKRAGTAYNVSLAATPSSIIRSGAAMTGGANGAWALNGNRITIPTNGFTLALPVLYTAGSLAITGLTNQTTYYAAPYDANTVSLATSSGNAVAGTYITLASTAAPTATHTYTLAPLAFAAGVNTGLKWQTSNDNSNWADMNVSTWSWVSGGGAGSTSWNLGTPGTHYVRAAVVGPTTGGLNLKVYVTGTQP